MKRKAYATSLFILLILGSLDAFADTQNATIAINDTNVSENVFFNFTSGLVGTNGHIKIISRAVGEASVDILAVNNTASRHQGWYVPEKFFDEFNNVPNISWRDQWGVGYTMNATNQVVKDNPIAYVLFGDSAVGTEHYAVLYVLDVNWSNISFHYKYNNVTGNSTFHEIGVCETHLAFDTCLADVENDCEWQEKGGRCTQRVEDFFDRPAQCAQLPRVACDAINDTFCSWDTSAGSEGLCLQGANYAEQYGYNCTAILDETVCNNQPFTAISGLCSWDGSVCLRNVTKTFDDLAEPPVFSCSAQGYTDNRSACDSLGNTYYMPCGWNNATDRCEAVFFDYGKFEDFGDINNENSCQTAGGSWKSESAYDPIAGTITTAGWCEFGVAVKTFDQIGAGGGGFGGSAGQINDCSRDCFACEFNGVDQWANASVAQNACTTSVAGCSWTSDTNAFNGQGWCEPAASFGGFSCDSFCGDCNLLDTAQTSCTTSPADCKWENLTQSCVPAGTKGCSQECTQCVDSASCSASPASGGCAWDSSGNFCKPESGSFEICFDGVDNDGDGKTDCADFNCATDPFCGGMEIAGATCFKYDPFSYGSQGAASGNCTADTDCTWITEGVHSFCAPTFEQCFLNTTLTTQSACESFGDGTVCGFESETVCVMNRTMEQACLAYGDSGSCNADSACVWDVDESFCEFKPFSRCMDNQTLQDDADACSAAGCYWRGDSFDSGFEGGFAENCVAPCENVTISNGNECAAANGTEFAPNTCVWQAGFCSPANFIGSCPDSDGDYTACAANTNCVWKAEPYGPLRNLNGSTDFRDRQFTGGVKWFAIGLQYPVGPGLNHSNYTLHATTGNLTLMIANQNATTVIDDKNISRISCQAGGSTTVIAEFNHSSHECLLGSCNVVNATATCDGSTVAYFLNNVSLTLEAVWQRPYTELVLDDTEGNAGATHTGNAVGVSTVTVDGILTDQFNESASAQDGTNATRSQVEAGICDDSQANNFFGGLEQNPPVIIATDTTDGAGDPGEDYLDISEVGVKKTPEAYMYGIPVQDIVHSAFCKDTPLQDNSVGQGQNTSKYYLYLDTDGSSSGGCAAYDDAGVAGFEYLFRYVAQIDQDTGKFTATTLSQKCSSGSWIATNIPFKTDRSFACNLIGGPIIGIDKESLGSSSSVDTTKGWRVYATSAAAAGNISNVSDKTTPGTADFKGIDTELVDCIDPASKDNTQCTKFKQFGFFPGEFGPACTDSKDNDGDGDTDCNDFDCKYDPFFCSGSFGAVADDTSAPTFVAYKVNTKLPKAITFIFDTNEPANGTVKFYNNDSACRTINTTILDKGLLDDDDFTDYRPHHVADIAGLNLNTTYFYKLNSCDPTGNCAVSKCSNATTALQHTNITFKIEIPSGWKMNIPQINLSNFSGQYALKASSEYLSGMNVTIIGPDNVTALTFVGVDIFEKQTLNISGIVSSSGLLGIDANQYQSFKQKTGVEEAHIIIPQSGDSVQHCDDDGANCQTVTSSLDCTFGSESTDCIIPDAVGLGFSTYKVASSTPDSPGGGSGGGGGGGSGGGGGGGTPSNASVIAKSSSLWDVIPVSTPQSIRITNEKIAISFVTFSLNQQAENAEVQVASIRELPDTVPAPDTTSYQYIEILHPGIENRNVAAVALDFAVPLSWISQNNADVSRIRLYRYAVSSWQALPTSYQSSDEVNAHFKARSTGLSYFAIGYEAPKVAPSAPGEEAIADIQAQETPGTSSETTGETGQVPGYAFAAVALVAMLIAVAYISYRKRRQ